MTSLGVLLTDLVS